MTERLAPAFGWELAPDDGKGTECEICGATKSLGLTGLGYPRGLVVDHNHVTGEFRGWLCNACNTALGMFRDDARLLRAAIKYLEEHGSYVS